AVRRARYGQRARMHLVMALDRDLFLALVVHDEQVSRHNDLQGIVAAAASRGFRPEQGDALTQHFRRGELIEDEIVPALGGEFDGGGTSRARPQQRMRRLLRGRLDDYVLEAPEAALVREALARRPRLQNNF